MEAIDKACPPSESMIFLGVLFNTITMTIEVTKERLIEIRNLIFSWLALEQASIQQIQSLLGKLNFVGSCVRPSRIFISRIFTWLRSLDKSDRFLKHIIPDFVKKDLIW